MNWVKVVEQLILGCKTDLSFEGGRVYVVGDGKKIGV